MSEPYEANGADWLAYYLLLVFGVFMLVICNANASDSFIWSSEKYGEELSAIAIQDYFSATGHSDCKCHHPNSISCNSSSLAKSS